MIDAIVGPLVGPLGSRLVGQLVDPLVYRLVVSVCVRLKHPKRWDPGVADLFIVDKGSDQHVPFNHI